MHRKVGEFPFPCQNDLLLGGETHCELAIIAFFCILGGPCPCLRSCLLRFEHAKDKYEQVACQRDEKAVKMH